MALNPKVKLKTVVSFPAAVYGGAGIAVRNQNGQFFFDLSFDDFAPPVSSVTASQNALLWDAVTKGYSLAPVSLFGASPSDTLPVVNGTAAAGILTTYSRGDHVHPTDTSRAAVTYVDAQDALKAPLASPVFTGNPTAPTPAPGDNDTSIATTAFVTAAVVAGGSVVPSNTNPVMDGVAAPGVSTLYSRGDHVHPSDTSRAPLVSPALTGTPTAPTAAPGTNTTQIATTAYADAIAALKANLASPVFTGNPTAPTPAVDDNDTSVATTAFVIGQASAAGDGTPAMDGVAARGTAIHWARADHIHPVDTSRAPLASPTFTGVPAAPTAAPATNTTQLATTAFVGAAVTAANVPPPATLAPLMDGVAAVGVTAKYAKEDHIHPTDTSRAPLASPALTGTPTAPTATANDNSTKLATTAYADAADALKAGNSRQVVFTSSGTYTPVAGLLFAIVEVIAGGGGGGPVPATTSPASSAGGGGSSGGYTRSVLTAAAIGGSQAVTVGAGGAGGTGSGFGSDGGNSSFGALVTALTGGGGGPGGAGSGGSGGVARGTGVGDFSSNGGNGFAGTAAGTAPYYVAGGQGGAGWFGQGGSGSVPTGPGFAAQAIGGGGGGAAAVGTAITQAGGNGKAGIVIITEFYK